MLSLRGSQRAEWAAQEIDQGRMETIRRESWKNDGGLEIVQSTRGRSNSDHHERYNGEEGDMLS